MLIRPATKEDKAQIIQLMEEFNSYYYEERIFSNEFKSFWEYKDKQEIFTQTVEEWLTNTSYYVFVAEEEAHLIGYIVGHVKERNPRVLDMEGYIDDWFVSKEWRSKGIGMKLYNPLIEKFKEQRCNRLGLLTNINNKHTIDFYHRLGFIDESLAMVKSLD